MQTRSDIQMHLSIWRPAAIDRRYLYGASQAGKEGVFVPIDDAGLLEQVYAWNPGPNDVLGACSPSVGRQIRERLVDPFASNALPGQRTIRRFRDAVNEILADHTIQGETFWTDCQETVKLEGDDDINLRANIALAVLRHFHWVAYVFLDVPQASVLVR